jgi:hypothetical protein
VLHEVESLEARLARRKFSLEGHFGQSGRFYRGLPPAVAGAVQNYGGITVFITYHGRTAPLYYLLASGMASNHVM